jgi:hypothetical protein
VGTKLRRRARRLAVALAIAWPLLASSPDASAKVFLTQEQALALAFGEAARAERRTAYLTEEQEERIREAAGSEISSRVIVYYVGRDASGSAVAAYFDTHLVRTLPETVMIVVGGGGKVRRVDILSFDEPEDYLPKRLWLDQFEGRKLDAELSTKRAIRAVTGATISSRTITSTVRRALAVHELLKPTPGGEESAP